MNDFKQRTRKIVYGKHQVPKNLSSPPLQMPSASSRFSSSTLMSSNFELKKAATALHIGQCDVCAFPTAHELKSNGKKAEYGSCILHSPLTESLGFSHQLKLPFLSCKIGAIHAPAKLRNVLRPWACGVCVKDLT